MSSMSYNGGDIMTMNGKNCGHCCQKIFPIGDWLYIGLAGLTSNVQTVAQHLQFQPNLYELKEGRQIKSYTFLGMVANVLYERWIGPYYTEPVITGLDLKNLKCLICSPDLICCPMVADNIVISGACSKCVSPLGPDMDLEHLLETISQTMNTVDRDALSGMRFIVHIIEKDRITTRTLRA
uniref:Uncharacterized protein n=1 Tax=Mustela putorius furo TaxID=9669 RepID=M3YEC5_MUSPF